MNANSMVVFSLKWPIIIWFIFQVSALTAKVNEARMDRLVLVKMYNESTAQYFNYKHYSIL